MATVAAERDGRGVRLFLGILAGSWGLTRWYANQIQSLIETRGALEGLCSLRIPEHLQDI